MKRLHIKYIGNFKHAHCTENDVMDGFTELGHYVEPIQEDSQSLAPFFGEGNYGDLLLYTRTWSFPQMQDAWFNRLLGMYRVKDIPTAAVHLDLFHGIGREHLLHDDPFFRMQHVFTADGGNEDKWGKINHHWLPPAVSSRLALQSRGEWQENRGKFGFVGTYKGYHPEWPWRKEMIDIALNELQSDFMLFSPETRGKQGRLVDPERMKLYQSGMTFLTDSLCLQGRYWSDRIPETLGYGAVAILPNIPELAEFQGPRYDRTKESLVAAFKEVRAMSDLDWNKISAFNRERILSGHTYRHRAQTILATIGLVPLTS